MVFRDRTYAVLLVSASEKIRSAVLPLLPSSEYYPVFSVESAEEARQILRAQSVDLVVIAAPLPDEFGSKLAADICRSSAAGVLLFVREELYDKVCSEVIERGVMVLSRPASVHVMEQALRMLCAARERFVRMEERQASVEDKIRELRTVDRAKWVLIETLGMTEADAHRYLERQAMDMRISRREAAENIIRAYS